MDLPGFFVHGLGCGHKMTLCFPGKSEGGCGPKVCCSKKLFDACFEWIWDIRVFPKIGVPQNGWFIMENPIKMDDLGVPLFSETSIYTYTYMKRHI